jgi:molybdate transport system permease protein
LRGCWRGFDFGAEEWLDAAITLPLVLPPTVLGYYLLVVLGQRSFLGRAHEWFWGSPLTFTPAAAVVAATIHALPSWSSRLGRRSNLWTRALKTLLERWALRTAGFFTVTLPLARRSIQAATGTGLLRVRWETFGVTLMIAGNIPGKTQTASVAIYDAVQADAIRMRWSLSSLFRRWLWRFSTQPIS